MEALGEDLVAQALCTFTFCTRLRSAVVAGAAGRGQQARGLLLLSCEVTGVHTCRAILPGIILGCVS